MEKHSNQINTPWWKKCFKDIHKSESDKNVNFCGSDCHFYIYHFVYEYTKRENISKSGNLEIIPSFSWVISLKASGCGVCNILSILNLNGVWE